MWLTSDLCIENARLPATPLFSGAWSPASFHSTHFLLRLTCGLRSTQCLSFHWGYWWTRILSWGHNLVWFEFRAGFPGRHCSYRARSPPFLWQNRQRQGPQCSYLGPQRGLLQEDEEDGKMSSVAGWLTELPILSDSSCGAVGGHFESEALESRLVYTSQVGCCICAFSRLSSGTPLVIP